MKILNEIGAMFTTEVITLLVIFAFLIVLYAIYRLSKAMTNNDTTASLKRAWDMVREQTFDAIIAVAATGDEAQVSKLAAERYELELGHPVDWRMVFVLQHVENFVESQLPIDVDLPRLYIVAESMYQQHFGDFYYDDDDLPEIDEAELLREIIENPAG